MKGEVRLELTAIYEVDSENYCTYEGPDSKEKPIETEEEFKTEVSQEIDNGDFFQTLEGADIQVKNFRFYIFPEKKEKEEDDL